MQMKFKESSAYLLFHQQYSHRTQRWGHVKLLNLMKTFPVNLVHSCPVSILHAFVFHIKCAIKAPQKVLMCPQTQHEANFTAAPLKCYVSANIKTGVICRLYFTFLSNDFRRFSVIFPLHDVFLFIMADLNTAIITVFCNPAIYPFTRPSTCVTMANIHP